MRRKKSTAPPRVLNPRRGCEFCGGTGWAKEPTGLVHKRVAGGQMEYGQVRRCSCTMPERRDEVAPQPAPPALDQAQRAAGEKEEA